MTNEKNVFVENFPFGKIRQQQQEVLDILNKEYDNYDYFIVLAPTGMGKSGIAKAVGTAHSPSFLITATKQLQEQYADDFPEPQVVSLKGKANYTCTINPTLNVETGMCLNDKDLLKDCRQKCICPYYNQRDKAISADIAVLSVPFFLLSAVNPFFWEKRKTMIVDECHLLEGQIVNWATLHIDINFFLKEYNLSLPLHNGTQDIEENEIWLKKVWDIVSTEVGNLGIEIKRVVGAKGIKEITKEEITLLGSTYVTYKKLDNVRKKMSLYFEDNGKDNWVCEANNNGVKLTPLKVDGMFKRLIDDKITDKIVFMTATLSDYKSFCRTLGIDIAKTKFISVDSSFDPKKSPIIYMGAGKMSYEHLNNTIPKINDKINEIIEFHEDEKGIIHTGNYRLVKTISEGVNTDRFIYKTYKESNEFLLQKHSESDKPTILLSPSLTTGVDLKDDLSRFQIIVKLPWASLEDLRTKTKSKLDGDWYVAEMFNQLIQSAGRSTRNEEDWSTTYILDSSFPYWLKKYSHWIPQDFRKRIITYK